MTYAAVDVEADAAGGYDGLGVGHEEGGELVRINGECVRGRSTLDMRREGW